jgi:hypothetical protein
VEYKSVSNFWMGSQAGCKWAYKTALAALRIGLGVREDYKTPSYDKAWGDKPRFEGIMDSMEIMADRWDVDRALYTLDEYSVESPPASIVTAGK